MSHYGAQKLIPVLGDCERCGAPAVDRHHQDRNPSNNTRGNIEQLCQSCHGREHRLEIAAGVRKAYENPVLRAKLSAAMTGKTRGPLSAETRAKISAALKGKATWNKGRTLSDEHRTKIGAAQISRPRSPETRAKISAALTGSRNPMYGRAPWNKGQKVPTVVGDAQS